MRRSQVKNDLSLALIGGARIFFKSWQIRTSKISIFFHNFCKGLSENVKILIILVYKRANKKWDKIREEWAVRASAATALAMPEIRLDFYFFIFPLKRISKF